MRPGIVVSAIAHAALIAWGFISLPSIRPLDTSNIEQIPVDFVEMADETKINKGVQTAALVEDVPAPEPAKKIVEEPPPLPKPEPVPDPEPAPPLPPPPAPSEPVPPQPEVTPPAPAEAEPPPPAPAPAAEAPPPPEKVVVAPKDVPIPRLRPTPPKPKPAPETTDTSAVDQIQALLDKRKLEQMASAEPEPEAKPTVGSATGSASVSKMTANELDALRAQLAQCWNPPIGWTDPSEVRVVLMLDLNEDGSVAGVPSVLESPQGQYSNTAPESALRAVRRCAPFSLPADKYDAWKQVKVTFDPRDMGGA